MGIRTSEGVHGDEHRTNVGVDLCVLPPFIEVLIDALVRDGGEEGHVRYADLLLLEAFLPVCLEGIDSPSERYITVECVRWDVPWQPCLPHPSWA